MSCVDYRSSSSWGVEVEKTTGIYAQCIRGEIGEQVAVGHLALPSGAPLL